MCVLKLQLSLEGTGESLCRAAVKRVQFQSCRAVNPPSSSSSTSTVVWSRLFPVVLVMVEVASPT